MLSSSKSKPKILICDDDQLVHLSLKEQLKAKYHLTSAYNSLELLATLKNQSFDLLLLDIDLKEDRDGIQLINTVMEIDPELAIVMNTGHTDFQSVRDAMRGGAWDYLAKSAPKEELLHIIDRNLEKRSLRLQNHQKNFQIKQEQKRHQLIGESEPLQHLRSTLQKLKHSRMNILITGETGCGKEVFARQLQNFWDDGSNEPFIPIDSSTIQSTMAESLLFGHEKGAFTGADKAQKGIFEEANQGTVYFDEIGNMPIEIQAKLLRVLEEKVITRLGSTKQIPLDFRVISATNRNLDQEAEKGSFKHDLLQRLNVIPVRIPPLRERSQDIPLLLEHFLNKHQPEKTEKQFSADAIEFLQNYRWPGNIRELSNLVAYLITMTEHATIEISDLPPKFRDEVDEKAPTPSLPEGAFSFYDKVAEFEEKLLRKTYDEQKGNISRMALNLGMDRSHLYSKLKNYGIHKAKSQKST